MLQADNGIVHLVSNQPFSAVLESLLSILQAKGMTVFAVIDHGGEAAKVGIDMPQTKLVIFGDPRAGTPLMIAAPDSALDLPLKILIAEVADGTTRVSYNAPSFLKDRFALSVVLIKNIGGIEKIAATLTGPGVTR